MSCTTPKTHRRDALHLLQRGLGRAGGGGDGPVVLLRVGGIDVEFLPHKRVAAGLYRLLAVVATSSTLNSSGLVGSGMGSSGLTASERRHAAGTDQAGGRTGQQREGGELHDAATDRPRGQAWLIYVLISFVAGVAGVLQPGRALKGLVATWLVYR